MTTQLPPSLPLRQYSLTITCPSGISDGRFQDESSFLVRPIHLGISGTLLAVHFSVILFVIELV